MTEDNKTVFTETPPITPTVTTTPAVSTTQPSIPPEVAEFVGAGKKYATLEEALKSVPHAQKHISEIEAALALAKEELTKRKTTEELLEELRNTGTQTTSTTTDNKPTFTPEQIRQMIAETLSATENQKTIKSNTENVVSTFKAKFGDKAEEVFINVAKESGLSIQALNSLAGTSPSAVLKLAGIEKQTTTNVSTKPHSDVNTEAFRSQGNPNSPTTARVTGTGTKDMVAAWKIAGELVGKTP